MSSSELDNFYLKLDEPLRSCFLALRDIILSLDEQITPEWKYKLPFFYYRKKMLCYLWKDKKTGEAYVGVANGMLIAHPALEAGERKRMKIYRVDPKKDINMEELIEILGLAIEIQNKG